MWTIFKAFIEFVIILLLLYALVFWPQGMWDQLPDQGSNLHPCIGRWNLNHWTAPSPVMCVAACWRVSVPWTHLRFLAEAAALRLEAGRQSACSRGKILQEAHWLVTCVSAFILIPLSSQGWIFLEVLEKGLSFQSGHRSEQALALSLQQSWESDTGPWRLQMQPGLGCVLREK